MRKIESKEIDGITFTVQQLDAARAMDLSHKLAETLAPAALKSGFGGVLSGELSDAALLFFEKFSAADLRQLVKDLFETATMEIDGVNFKFTDSWKEQLAGKTFTLYKAIWFALAVNFPDFSDLVSLLKAKVKARESKASTTSQPGGPVTA